MILEKRIRLILHAILLISIIAFYIIAEVPQFFLTEPDSTAEKANYFRLSNLRRLIGIMVSLVIIMSFFRWQKITKAMFWFFNEKYIAGKYKGYSKKMTKGGAQKKEEEIIEIKQSLFKQK